MRSSITLDPRLVGEYEKVANTAGNVGPLPPTFHQGGIILLLKSLLHVGGWPHEITSAPGSSGRRKTAIASLPHIAIPQAGQCTTELDMHITMCWTLTNRRSAERDVVPANSHDAQFRVRSLCQLLDEALSGTVSRAQRYSESGTRCLHFSGRCSRETMSANAKSDENGRENGHASTNPCSLRAGTNTLSENRWRFVCVTWVLKEDSPDLANWRFSVHSMPHALLPP